MEYASLVAEENRIFFTEFFIYGVSVESEDVRWSIYNFLSFGIYRVGSTGTNHNMKSWWYQIFGGYFSVTIGTYVIDANILRLSVISANILCPIDFASEFLVLKLASHNMVQSLYE